MSAFGYFSGIVYAAVPRKEHIMTSADLSVLADLLYDLAPHTVGLPGTMDPADQHALAQRLEDVCLAHGCTHMQAVVIADALAGYVGGWGGRYGNLDNHVEMTQMALGQALGNTQLDVGVSLRPDTQRLTAEAIRVMLGWVLTDVEEG